MGNSGLPHGLVDPKVFKEIFRNDLKEVLIGIHAKPKSGKDTLANYIVKKYSFLKYGPSFPVKETASTMFNVPINYFWDENLKEEVIPYWNMSPRVMAQMVGTECSRNIFGNDFWMRHVECKWKEILHQSRYQGMILADVRYENEVEWIKQHEGVVIYLDRPDREELSTNTHPVDMGLPKEICTHYIYNDGTKEELFAKAEEILLQ
ncbi:MAG: hypothetical protein ACREAU_01680 [Nitrosopumilaceae archaeon]